MYEAHFRLDARPFAETTGASRFVPLPSRLAALHRLRYGLDPQGPGLAVMLGASGSGKTCVAHRLAHELARPVVHLSYPAMPADELLASLADAFAGVRESASGGVAESVERIRSALAASASRGDRPLLVVDEAHLIPDESTFESLRLLLNFATVGTPDLGILLVGSGDLMERLPGSLVDRLGARCPIAALTASESAAYVMAKLAMAGATQPLFGMDALKALHRESGGMPRRLNRLADLALLIAYARDRADADADAVALAANEAGFAYAA